MNSVFLPSAAGAQRSTDASITRRTVQFADVHVYIINLDESRNRWIQCFRRMAGVFPSQNIHRIPALDGRSLAAPARPEQWQPQSLLQLQREGYLAQHETPDPVRTAVCLSHQRALRTFLNDATNYDHESQWALILEDDALPAEALLAHPMADLSLDIPSDSDLIFLHDRVLGRGNPNSPAAKPDSIAQMWLPDVFWRTVTGGIGLEAYLVSPAGAQKMLDAWQPLHFECDVQLMAFMEHSADPDLRHRLLALRKASGQTSHPVIRAYVPQRPLVQIDETLPSVKLQLLEPPSNVGSKPGSSVPQAYDVFQFNRALPIAFATAWFNPFHYRSRLENLLRFLDGMSDSNVLVLELAFGEDEWQLPDDIPNLVRLRSDTVCWQKEALLNHGLAILDQMGFRHLGWLDADVVFDTPGWQDRLLEVLQTKRLCQVFETVSTHFPDRGPECQSGAAASWVNHEQHPVHCGVTGFGWAMHREVWQSSRLFDWNLVGGGDHIMWRSAFYGHIATRSLFADRIYPKQFEPLRNDWADCWARAVGLQIGHAYGVQLASLPHGSSHARRYLTRGQLLRDHDFQIYRDVERDMNGLLRWRALAAIPLRDAVRDYFSRRHEDVVG